MENQNQNAYVCFTEVDSKNSDQQWDLEIPPKLITKKDKTIEWVKTIVEKAKSLGLSFDKGFYYDDENTYEQQFDNDKAILIALSDKQNNRVDIRAILTEIE